MKEGKKFEKIESRKEIKEKWMKTAERTEDRTKILSKNEMKEILEKGHSNIEKTDRAFEIFMKAIANGVYEIIGELEDNDCRVFAPTHGSGTIYGYAVKKAWETAHPEKPRIITIPITTTRQVSDWIPVKRNIVAEDFRKKYDRYHLDPEKDKVLVFDETHDTGESLSSIHRTVEDAGLKVIDSAAEPMFRRMHGGSRPILEHLPPKGKMSDEEYKEELNKFRTSKSIENKAIVKYMKLIGEKVGEKINPKL